MFLPTISLKKLSLIFGGILLAFMLLAPDVSAQSTAKLCDGADLTFSGSGSCQADGEAPGGKVNDLIEDIVNIFSIIVGIAAVIMIIYGGFRFVTSGGDSGAISTAKNTILYAIVGLIIVAFAQLIVKFILNKIGQ